MMRGAISRQQDFTTRSGSGFASHRSTPTIRREDFTTRSGSGSASHHSILPSHRGGHASHHSTPTSRCQDYNPRHACARPLAPYLDIPIPVPHDDVDLNIPVGGFTRLLNQMDMDRGHFSDDEIHEEDHEETPFGSNSSDMPAYGTSQKPVINIIGKKFGDHDVHQAVRRLIDQYLNGPWISFKHIPNDVINQMWERFKILYDWDKSRDEQFKTNLKNVASHRYRDVVRNFRKTSARMAIAAGHNIAPGGNDFVIMRDFLPPRMQSERWLGLCREWNTNA